MAVLQSSMSSVLGIERTGYAGKVVGLPGLCALWKENWRIFLKWYRLGETEVYAKKNSRDFKQILRFQKNLS